MEEDLWPEGTYVRWWRQPRQLKNSVSGPPSTTQVSASQLVNTDTARLEQTLNCGNEDSDTAITVPKYVISE